MRQKKNVQLNTFLVLYYYYFYALCFLQLEGIFMFSCNKYCYIFHKKAIDYTKVEIEFLLDNLSCYRRSSMFAHYVHFIQLSENSGAYRAATPWWVQRYQSLILSIYCRFNCYSLVNKMHWVIDVLFVKIFFVIIWQDVV